MEHYKSVYNSDLHKYFHKNTSLNNYNKQTLNRKINDAFNNDLFLKNCFRRPVIYDYNNEVTVKLEKSFELPSYDLFEGILRRRTNRNFTGNKKISKNILSAILYYSFGVTCFENEFEGQENPLYTYPTAGGLNSTYVYVYIKKVENIENGLYLYNPFDHEIKKLILILRFLQIV